jgi:hypothetical protein
MTYSRRRFLTHAGVTLALPFLASLGRHGRAADPPKPRRLLFVYVPNGMHMAAWKPATFGPGWSSEILDDLTDMKAQATVISGLQNLPGRPDGAGDHAAGTGAFLTCTHVHKTEGDDIRNGISVDQVAANALAAETRFASLELGIEGGQSVGGCDSGYSCAYTRNIAWSGPATPRPKIANPRILFDRLFAGEDPAATAAVRERRLRARRSVLDWVREDANALSAKVSRSDRQKLDEYLTGLRELEGRLTPAASCALPDAPTDDLDLEAQLEVTTDLLVLALKCDLTRVTTLMLANAGSGRAYTFLDPTLTGGHHDLSHHQNDPENFRKLTLINRWEVRKLASLARKLHAEKDDDGTSLLDQSLVFFSSEIADGNSHTHTDLPVLILGRGGDALTPGQHIARTGQPMANLFIAMLASVGVSVPSFGDDGTGPLALV